MTTSPPYATTRGSSRLFAERAGLDLDEGEPGIQPQFHTFVASRATWDELPDDGLPQYHEGVGEISHQSAAGRAPVRNSRSAVELMSSRPIPAAVPVRRHAPMRTSNDSTRVARGTSVRI